jgi:hypothetical protein
VLQLLESTKATDIVLGSTESANYRGSYTAIGKGIVDTEIAMHQKTAGTIITTKMEMLCLLKLSVAGEQEGGSRN